MQLPIEDQFIDDIEDPAAARTKRQQQQPQPGSVQDDDEPRVPFLDADNPVMMQVGCQFVSMKVPQAPTGLMAVLAVLFTMDAWCTLQCSPIQVRTELHCMIHQNHLWGSPSKHLRSL